MKFGRAFVLVFLVLLGCDELLSPKPFIKPATRPDTLTVSEESQRIAAYYASVQARLISQGKLRQEYAPKDALFTPDDLVRNFEKVALFDEYALNSGSFVEQQTSSYLRRWTKPVRIGLYFGPSVTPEQREIDRKTVFQFANRLSALTGLSIRLSDFKNANFIMLFMNRDSQKTETPLLAEDVPQLLPSIIKEIQNSPRNIFCVAYALSNADRPTVYSGAVILVKAEHSQIMRNSCIQEEMTQALGLANDGPDIRPSIFNDDEEFALLTRHDELLLKMLYDPRLKVGMTPEIARPVLQQVAENALKQSRI